MNWPLFGLLWLGGMAGVLAVIPYSLSLQRLRLEETGISPRRLLFMSALQGGILLAVAVGLGLLAADAVGLGAPRLQALLAGQAQPGGGTEFLLSALAGGGLGGALILLLEKRVFAAHLPAALRDAAAEAPLWQRIAATLYGGITEELLLRLFLMSGLLWLLKVTGNAPPPPAPAILLGALLLGIGHLPATARLSPLTPLLIGRALLLNGIPGLITGWLYWRLGLEAAMLAHFTTDQILHVWPILCRRLLPGDMPAALRSDPADDSASSADTD